MSYVVYNTATGLVDSFRITQALADTRAGEDTALSAYQGNVTRPRWVQPGGCYFKTADASFAEDSIPVLTGLALLQATTAAVHDAFFGTIHPRIKLVAEGHLRATGDQVLDIITGQLEATYIKLHDTSLSYGLRMSYVSQAPLGPTEITGHGTNAATELLFVTLASTIIRNGFVIGDPISFLVLNTAGTAYERRNMQASVDAATVDFASDTTDFRAVHLADKAWIATIPETA